MESEKGVILHMRSELVAYDISEITNEFSSHIHIWRFVETLDSWAIVEGVPGMKLVAAWIRNM